MSRTVWTAVPADVTPADRAWMMADVRNAEWEQTARDEAQDRANADQRPWAVWSTSGANQPRRRAVVRPQR